MRRVEVVAGFAGVLLAVVGLGAVVGASPRVRARYHLRFVTQTDMKFALSDEPLLTGHARAFVASAAAKDVLPELLDRAEEESRTDEEWCFRALVLVPEQIP